MADWYASSVSYAAVPQFAINTAYTVGQFIRSLAAPQLYYQHVYRCTTAGTTAATEPSWNTSDGATTTSGTAVFTNVTGRSTYGWSAAAGNIYSLGTAGSIRTVIGDRIFVASDHSETHSTSSFLTLSFSNTAGFGAVQIISVNRAGSVPPVAADVQSGAVFNYTYSNGVLLFENTCNQFFHGITFNASVNTFYINSSANKGVTFKNCAIVLTYNGVCLIRPNNPGRAVLDNTTIQFCHAGQAISTGGYAFDFTWLNTSSAVQGTPKPTTLFLYNGASLGTFTCRGVDFSSFTGNLVDNSGNAGNLKVLFDSCTINSAATRYVTPTTGSPTVGELELVNCFDGTNVLNERYPVGGAVTTDRTTYMLTGAQDDIGVFSLKMAASRADKFALPLDSFPFDVENTAIGAVKTATVEVASGASLNNDDIQLLLEYMGTSGSSIASFSNSLASVLTAVAALPTSTATWTTPAFAAFDPVGMTGTSTLSNNNLTITTAGGTIAVRANSGASTGKFYFEFVLVTPSGFAAYGLHPYTPLVTNVAAASNGGVFLNSGGIVYVNGTNTASIQSPSGTVGIAIDLGAKLIWFRNAPSGNWNNNSSNNPATGVGGISFSALSGLLYPGLAVANNGDVYTANFGASAFTGAVPSGFTSGWPFTPVKQNLQVTFTPQRAGRVRGLVRLGKINATVWVNPQMRIA